MAYASVKFVNLKFKPSKNDLIAEFLIEPRNVSFEGAAEAVAAESSIGTWTEIGTLSKKILDSLKPSVSFLGVVKVKKIRTIYNLKSDSYIPFYIYRNCPYLISNRDGAA
ncbi:hypothetical protein HZB89_01075 [archaeon]|nr:hypothetical protein [archaeon]